MTCRIASAVMLLVMWCGLSPCRAQDDVADVPCEDLRVGGNEQQRYFLIGLTANEKQPKDGFPLLLILPGGDGSADFNPFVKRIWKNALPEGMLVAQLVAVASDNKDQIVWPTAKDKEPKQKFTTEAFIKAVVTDIKAKHKIDDAKVYALGLVFGRPRSLRIDARERHASPRRVRRDVRLPPRQAPAAGSGESPTVFPASVAARSGHQVSCSQRTPRPS